MTAPQALTSFRNLDRERMVYFIPHLWRPKAFSNITMRSQVNPQFYAFRWITLLLTQEFSFPDSIRLWDTLFSDTSGRFDCMLRFCCAMLINVREELLKVLPAPRLAGAHVCMTKALLSSACTPLYHHTGLERCGIAALLCWDCGAAEGLDDGCRATFPRT